MKRYIEFIVKFIKKNKLVPKLVSILLAVILWGYISSSKTGDVVFKAPITFNGLEDNLIVSKTSHRIIEVEVRGRKDDLTNVNSRNIKLTVDLSTAEPGIFQTHKVQFQKIDLQDDFDIQLEPPEVKIFVERKISRNVKIVPRFSGKTEKGYMIGRIRVNPEYVKITGPSSIINNLGVIYTDKIPVDNRNIAYRQDVKIEKVSEEVLEYSLSKVNVTVPVIVNLEMKSFEIPVIIRNKKKGLHYLIVTDKVKIDIIMQDKRKIDENSFIAYIDADEIDFNHEEFLQKRRVEIMGFVHISGEFSENDDNILSISPDSVEVIVTKE